MDHIELPAERTRSNRVRRFVRRHPIGVFLTTVLALTWATQFTLLANGEDLTPALLAELVFLLGASTLITAWTQGRPGVRRLYAGITCWRLGVGRYAVLLAAMPILTLLVAGVTGTLRHPDGGWPKLVLTYLFMTLIFGALLGNLWEETAWSGFVQSRLMTRRGLLIGSLITAVPFVLVHLPLIFAADGRHGTSWHEAALDLGLLAAAAPFFRYLIGTFLVDTGGSILAVALLHASFNAAGSTAAVDGGWQYIPAMIILTLLVVAYRARRKRSAVHGNRQSGNTERRPAEGGRRPDRSADQARVHFWLEPPVQSQS
jgi:membrane protease YdiL (CAAX protease family)